MAHDPYPVKLCHAAYELLQRYKQLNNLNDLTDGIALYRQALHLARNDHSDKPYWLTNLGFCLELLFSRSGEGENIDSSISAYRDAIGLTYDKDPALPLRLSNLVDSLMTRFTRFGEPSDLESALETSRRAIALTPDGDPELPPRLNDLARSLWARFERFGEPSDLESALEICRRAVALTPDGDPELPLRLGNLAVSLDTRFDRFGEPSDLESALEKHRRAIALTPDGDPELPPRLSNLAVSLCNRFNRFGDPSDLESALEICRRAVALTPEDAHRLPLRLGNLAVSLHTRFQRFGEPSDLERALETERRAVALTPEDDPDLPLRLSNLAISLRARFDRFGEPSDLESALEANFRAVQLTPEGHPEMSGWMNKLGKTLESRFTHDRTQKHFDEVAECYLAAATQSLGQPSWRFRSVNKYVQILTNHPEFCAPDSLLLAHSLIMHILSELVWLGYSVRRRFEESALVGGFVNAAVSVAIDSNNMTRAVEWLEAGRSLIWSQVASMRTPLDDLAERLPESAQKLHEIQLELQQLGVTAQTNPSGAANRDMIAHDGQPVRRDVYAETAVDQYRRAAIRYDSLVKDIRGREGFRDFMQPKTLADFVASPAFTRLDGHVIFINVVESSCDALILLSSGTVKLVKLPKLSQKRANTLRTLWAETIGLRRAHRRGNEPRAVSRVRGGYNVYALVLGRLWMWVVCPILEALDFTTAIAGEPLPHVIWCPTGPLTQLPLHAAGIYGKKPASPCTFDLVVSSYTPSLSALMRCLERNDKPCASPRMLLVAQTNTPRPGLIALPHVHEESARVRALLHGGQHTFLEGKRATVDSVLAAINQHPWVHFACHGSQHPSDPTLTSIELHDKPLTLGDLMSTVSDNAELAFLSACETAVGDKKIPEESAHLAAGMMAVGFKGVIATMWSIHDQDGPIIVEAYYKNLLELRASGTVPRGHTGAAYALHHAVEVLRKEVGESYFERWVPFVHFGV
ncbi:hypothetical protein PENSPDRAFT_635733 [Peniophora sp. CONT]|nr:hypothetical protein PENSPDRAFT_635733 [Peniophora sp. CONT]